MLISMSQWGKGLGTRFLGEEVRNAILEILCNNREYTITLDFNGVSIVSHSFADECFGKLSESIGLESLRNHLRFTNYNPLIEKTIVMVINNRAQTSLIN